MRAHAEFFPILALAAFASTASPAEAQGRRPEGVQVDEPLRRSAPAPLGAEARRPAAPALPAVPPPVILREPATQGMPEVGERLEHGQTEDELVRTSLLNRFGGLGFAELGRLHREGDLYAAEVRTVDGQWVLIFIDPRTGEIVSRR